MKKNFLFRFPFFLVGLFTIASCFGPKNLDIAKPEATPVVEQPFVIPNSQLNMGVSITWAELSRQVTAMTPTQLMDDKTFNDDGLKINLKRSGDIKISFLVNKVQTVVPISARVWYRYGIFGATDVKEFRMKGDVHLLSFAVMDEMSIKTMSKIDKIVWEENPTLVFYGKNVPMGFLIDPILNSQSENIAKNIDKILHDLLDFKDLIKKELNAFQEAILISEDYKMWLEVLPQSFFSSPLKMNKEKLYLDLTMIAQLKTTLGAKPAKNQGAKNLSFKSEITPERATQIKLPVETSYLELSKLFTKEMKGMLLYDGKKKVVLDSIALWQSNKKLSIALLTSGAVKGWIYLNGIPKYDAEKEELFIDELDYQVETKNVLVKSINWLLSGKILPLIKENARYPLKNDLEMLRKDLNKELDNYKLDDKTKIRFKLQSLLFESIALNNDAIITIFDLKALIKTEIG